MMSQRLLPRIFDRCLKNPRSTPAIPHGLNLVIEHGCEAITLISKVYDVLEQLFVFFTKSTKRNKELKDKHNQIENALQLRNLLNY